MDANKQTANDAAAQAVRSAAEEDADPRVDLAVQRTELALDRTQLAWVRTAFTCITAGLAIDKGAEALHKARVVAGTNWVSGSHFVGVVLAAMSTFLLLVASVEYSRQVRRLARIKGTEPRPLPLGLFISVLVIVLGAALSILMLSWELAID